MEEQTPEQKELAVLVAKDVLVTLNSHSDYAFQVRTGQYYFYLDERSIPGTDFTYWLNLPSQEQVNIAKNGCTVCALGACLISLVSLRNEFSFNSSVLGKNDVNYKLMDCFTLTQQELIEIAFEQRIPINFSMEESEISARLFGLKIGDDRDRLRAIMLNIIENGGTFKP